MTKFSRKHQNSTQKVQNIWQNTQGFNSPAAILNQITSNQAISAKAYRCWMKLFTLSYLGKTSSLRLSEAELGKMLKCNLGSIKQSLTELESAGYLIVNPIIINNVWLTSEIVLTAPDRGLAVSFLPLQSKTDYQPSALLADAKNAANSSNKFHVEPANVTYSLIQRQTNLGGR